MSSSSKRQKGTDSWLKKRRGKSVSSQSKYYQDLDLPLHNFIQCLIKSDLTQLVISGKPAQEDLAEAWANIYSKYLDINYENETVYILQLHKEITLLNCHVLEVETSLYFLSMMYNADLVRILRNNGYKDKFESEDPIQYLPILEGIRGKLALKKLTLQSKEDEYKQYIKDRENDQIDDKYFIVMLMRLAKYQGVAVIRAKDISVNEFVVLLKEFLEFVRLNSKDIEDGDQRKNK